MAKKAYMVWATVGTRVVAEEDTPLDEIYLKSLDNLVTNLKENGYEVCETIHEDTENPYDPTTDL